MINPSAWVIDTLFIVNCIQCETFKRIFLRWRTGMIMRTSVLDRTGPNIMDRSSQAVRTGPNNQDPNSVCVSPFPWFPMHSVWLVKFSMQFLTPYHSLALKNNAKSRIRPKINYSKISSNKNCLAFNPSQGLNAGDGRCIYKDTETKNGL